MKELYDICIVGGGPAGLTAAVYGLRNGKTVLVIEKDVFGGQITNSPLVENIPGFKEISGDEFGDLLLEQARNQGGDVTFGKVIKVESDGNLCTITLDTEEIFKSKTCILATGTKHRTLGLDNEENFIGKGIHFCAVCDGNMYKDKEVVMVGGGNSALVEANLLVNSVSKLTILQDLPYFTGETKLQEKLFSNPKVEKHVNTKVKEYIISDNKISGIKYEENGEEKIINCDGIFEAIGLIPDNEYFKNIAELDERGYFKADELGITKTPNIFVAGDARSKSLRQVATACSDGANAAIQAVNFLK